MAELKHAPSSPKPRTVLKGAEKENSLIMTQKKSESFFFKPGNAFLETLAFAFF